MKKSLRILHLWLGMTAGLIVFIISLAAALFVFEVELNEIFYRQKIFVKVDPGASTLPLSELFAKAQAALPDQKVHSAEIKTGPYAYVFNTFEAEKEPGWTFFSEYKHWSNIYLNPYTGEVQGITNQMRNPITLFRFLHQQLLLRYDIGHQIVAVSTFIFFVMVLSGLVLWWPRKLKQGLVVNRKAGSYIRNYDLHRIGGFYIHLFILLIGATGLVWSYQWWSNSVYRLLGSDPATLYKNEKPETPLPDANYVATSLDKGLGDALKRRESWNNLYVTLPGAWGGDDKDISIQVNFDGPGAWADSDTYRYHPETGAMYHQFLNEDKSVAEKFRNTNYEIHVGSIFGWPSKILAFVVALTAASLPVTGFLVWKHKRRRKIAAFMNKFKG